MSVPVQKAEHAKLFVVLVYENGAFETRLIGTDGIHWNKRTRAYPTPAGARMYRNRLRSQGRQAFMYEVRIWDNGYVSGEIFE